MLNRIVHIRPSRALVDDGGIRARANRVAEDFVVTADNTDQPTFVIQRASNLARAVAWLVDATLDATAVDKLEAQCVAVESTDAGQLATLAACLDVQICVVNAAVLPLRFPIKERH